MIINRVESWFMALIHIHMYRKNLTVLRLQRHPSARETSLTLTVSALLPPPAAATARSAAPLMTAATCTALPASPALAPPAARRASPSALVPPPHPCPSEVFYTCCSSAQAEFSSLHSCACLDTLRHSSGSPHLYTGVFTLYTLVYSHSGQRSCSQTSKRPGW